ncbi:SHOCT domain-containing protein [Oryzobacter sp. R7]|uniref:SHOCT domain-containing protein n=1 Tax=Oryzobacter faecalis TaxID=3388656 RepID=UPI00398CF77B
MYWNGGMGPAAWWGMGLGMVVFWLVLLVTVALVVRWAVDAPTGGRTAPRGPAEGSGARAILDERFARGEIDEETYRRASAALRGL